MPGHGRQFRHFLTGYSRVPIAEFKSPVSLAGTSDQNGLLIRADKNRSREVSVKNGQRGDALLNFLHDSLIGWSIDPAEASLELRFWHELRQVGPDRHQIRVCQTRRNASLKFLCRA